MQSQAPETNMPEISNEIAVVLEAGNIDTSGLTVPDVAMIDAIEDNQEAALMVDRAFRALHTGVGRAWIVMGEYAELVNRRALWKELINPKTGGAYSSFKDWCESATEKGRTTVYGEMTLVRELPITRDEMAEISKANCFTLLKVKRRAGASKIDADLVRRAKSMKDPEFARYCQTLMPGAAADELQDIIKFAVPTSVGDVFRETVLMLQVHLRTNDWERIIERMCLAVRDAEFDNEFGDLTALEGKSNWEAFTVVQQSLAATGKELKVSGMKMRGASAERGKAQPEQPSEFEANTNALAESEKTVWIGLEDDPEAESTYQAEAEEERLAEARRLAEMSMEDDE